MGVAPSAPLELPLGVSFWHRFWYVCHGYNANDTHTRNQCPNWYQFLEHLTMQFGNEFFLVTNRTVFYFHAGSRFMVAVFWYRFSAPISSRCHWHIGIGRNGYQTESAAILLFTYYHSYVNNTLCICIMHVQHY